jgi:hypothetical protein
MATPSRNTRSRSRQITPSALPAIDRQTSSAYGSRGKANLRSQLAAAGTTLAQGFTTARGLGALPEDEEERTPQPQIQRQGTVVESFAHYEGSQRSSQHGSNNSMPPPPLPQPPPPPAARRAASPPPPVEPWSLLVLLFAVPRYLWRNKWPIILGALFALFLGTVAHILLPYSAGAVRDQFFSGQKIAVGLPGYDQPLSPMEALYKKFAEDWDTLPDIKDPVLQGLINMQLRKMIREGENNSTALFNRVDALEGYLPPRMVVDVVDDKLVIKEQFWNVLASKIRGDTTMFDAFVAANEKAATDIALAVSENQLSTAMENKRVLGPVQMMEILNDYAKDLDNKLETWSVEQLAITRKLATQVAKEVSQDMASDPRTQLSVLIKSRIIANIYESLSSVNYFSPHMGAVVDPRHSSPTALKPSKRVGWFGGPIQQPTVPPATAIMQWGEAGECWCAAKSVGIHGKAQLAIMTEHTIIPRRLIIEHIPSAGAQTIGSAPQDFELWAEVFTDEKAEAWKRQLRHGHHHYDAECAQASPPTNTSVCIASGTYDIHAENWVQSFDMFMDLEDKFPRIGAGKFFYRVMTNWQSDQTCTYRVRLTGTDMDELEKGF